MVARPQSKSTFSRARTPPYRLEILERTRKLAPVAADMARPGHSWRGFYGAARGGPAHRRATLSLALKRSLCVFLTLGHDLWRREVNAAGRELIVGKEIGFELGPIVHTWPQILVGRDRDRNRNQLRHCIALQRRNRRFHRDGDKCG